jgi:hypothetical protein
VEAKGEEGRGSESVERKGLGFLLLLYYESVIGAIGSEMNGQK